MIGSVGKKTHAPPAAKYVYISTECEKREKSFVKIKNLEVGSSSSNSIPRARINLWLFLKCCDTK